MLGHKLYQGLSGAGEAWVTVRSNADALRSYGFYCPDHVLGGVDANKFETVEAAINRVQPDVVVNCIGLIKQQSLGQDAIACITLNSLFPHQAYRAAHNAGARFIHISTDCVFSGKKGNYSESDSSDAEDMYGRSKYLGEVSDPGALTIRTSIIGRELSSSFGLVDWFLSNEGKTVKGFRNAIFTGFTTQELTQVIGRVIADHRDLTGLYQVSTDPINKNDLLHLMRDAYKISVDIQADDAVRIDRSLDSHRFRQETGYTPPSWPYLIERMVNDPTPYSTRSGQ